MAHSLLLAKDTGLVLVGDSASTLRDFTRDYILAVQKTGGIP